MLDAFDNGSQVFTHLTVENECSPVELVKGITCTSLQIFATWSIKYRSSTFKDFPSFKMSSKHSGNYATFYMSDLLYKSLQRQSNSYL